MYFGDKDPIGHQIQLGKAPDQTASATVVGIAADVIYAWTDQVPQAAVYLSDLQFPSNVGTYVLRAAGSPGALAPAARHTLASMDATVPVDPAETYAQFLHESLIGFWYVAVMLAVDAGMALVLCALGIFGVMANMVTERTHEIGIRLAVGADRAGVLRLLLRRSLVVTAWGLGAGLVLGVGVGRVLTGILQGVAGLQGEILLAAALLVAAISVFAGYLPARRAAQLDPMEALRTE